ncbi:VOC family protein [Pseudomonas stutzeri]|uniref:Bleomycin resistance protein n=1 Tax=Stutzerimonas stutzeri TaxID=316 RepID=A0A2N8SUQ5_STUST|nr:VOC family protein [Stutzerimonas stutzeri]MCQ4249270.1 VOC family protein [Stutzerimonas stutzeri]PNG06212.1 glyoxalase [Stutzerimonas stutzeri]PNG12375.1 glyoxalase [Stutzerimonas stutzeri]
MTTSIEATVPVLASLGLDESRDFYVSRLGFRVLRQDADYLMLARDGAELHFWLCADRHVAENTSCYVRTGDCQALFDEFSRRGLALQPPVLRPWGMKELYVIDPHGNLLKFGEHASITSTSSEENCS